MRRVLKKQKLKDEIYSIIRNDIYLRTLIADALNMERESVYTSARRKTARFAQPAVVSIISKHLKKTKIEILEPKID